ncbi:MAG: hypothetical protein ABJA98_26725 [Acidobacteriota bacterium]
MIRPLRRRHRWIMPGLLLVLAMTAVLALTHPQPSARMDVLSRETVDRHASSRTR